MRPRGFSATMAHRLPASDDTDFFPTPPWGARVGAEIVKLIDPRARTVWEPACGAGHMAHGLRDYFPVVHASDAYVYDRNRVFDFVDGGDAPFACDWVITNPPFIYLHAFVRLGLQRARRGVAMLMRLAVLEGQSRYQLLYRDCPLSFCSPFAERLPMAKGRYDPDLSSAAAYAWFFFIKGQASPVLSPTGLNIRGLPRILPVAPGAKDRLTRPSDAAYAIQDAEWMEMAA